MFLGILSPFSENHSENFFWPFVTCQKWLFWLKWRSAHARSRGESNSKNEFEKQRGTNKSVIGLSKSIFIITIEFLIKFRVRRWIRNFKILFYSRVMSYESFFEKWLYESYMTHNIYNIHIIRLQISFLI